MAGSSTYRIVFLCSGGGGNLRFMHRAIALGWVPEAEIAAVLTDRQCGASTYAAASGIPHEVIDFGGDGQERLLAALHAWEADLIVTTVHRILRPSVVEAFRGRLLNVHYSLLPAFGGLIGARPIEAALAYGAKFGGVTTHEVDETVDGGRPVVQAVFPLRIEDDTASLMNLVFRCGCLSLMAAVKHLRQREGSVVGESMTMLDRPCWFSAPIGVSHAALGVSGLWEEIAADAAHNPGKR